MKSKLLFLLGAGILLLATLPFLRSRPTSILWYTTTVKAFDEAREGEKPVLTFLYTDWCGYCRQMDSTTFTDSSVIEELGDRVIWLRLNAETDEEGVRLARKFQVSGYPTLLLLDPEGDEIDRLQGFMPPERFLQSVDESIVSAESFAEAQELIETDPENAEARYALAEHYLRRSMFADAVPHLTKVIELDPANQFGNTDASLYYLAESLTETRSFEAAIEKLETLQYRFPESHFASEAELMKAEILLFSGKKSEARLLLAQFVDNNPDHVAAEQIREFLDETSVD
jgi:thioredoxin-like negative regulator of GroEL